jgi:hypothetical protein
MNNPTPQLVALGIGITIAAVVVAELLALPTGEMHATMQAAEQWCHSMNGSLGVSRVIGEHGGLHCRQPNGTLVEYQ